MAEAVKDRADDGVVEGKFSVLDEDANTLLAPEVGALYRRSADLRSLTLNGLLADLRNVLGEFADLDLAKQRVACGEATNILAKAVMMGSEAVQVLLDYLVNQTKDAGWEARPFGGESLQVVLNQLANYQAVYELTRKPAPDFAAMAADRIVLAQRLLVNLAKLAGFWELPIDRSGLPAREPAAIAQALGVERVHLYSADHVVAQIQLQIVRLLSSNGVQTLPLLNQVGSEGINRLLRFDEVRAYLKSQIRGLLLDGDGQILSGDLDPILGTLTPANLQVFGITEMAPSNGSQQTNDDRRDRERKLSELLSQAPNLERVDLRISHSDAHHMRHLPRSIEELTLGGAAQAQLAVLTDVINSGALPNLRRLQLHLRENADAQGEMEALETCLATNSAELVMLKSNREGWPGEG